jgi:hypothetical protein|tara:strand:- start:43 stop:315 length:273 start_codon:yes stop_codon:yes gene_type:complete
MGYRKRGNMEIKIGDTITDERGRTGELNQIGIATHKTDVAGELGLKAKEYDTDLNYTGSIIFGDYWCYFYQIRKVNNTDINIDLTDWIGF